MDKKYLLISMDDERAKPLSDVLKSKTAKKIMDILAEENELSEKDIADKLDMPINTIEYNLKKLVKAHLVEKSKQFFWSKKGRKIDMYKLSNKSIIISPKSRISSKIKSILPVALLSGLGVVVVKSIFFSLNQQILSDEGGEMMLETSIHTLLGSTWIWFIAGALLGGIIYWLLRRKKL